MFLCSAHFHVDLKLLLAGLGHRIEDAETDSESRESRQADPSESAPCVMSEDTTSTSSWQVNAATHLCRQPAILVKLPSYL